MDAYTASTPMPLRRPRALRFAVLAVLLAAGLMMTPALGDNAGSAGAFAAAPAGPIEPIQLRNVAIFELPPQPPTPGVVPAGAQIQVRDVRMSADELTVEAEFVAWEGIDNGEPIAWDRNKPADEQEEADRLRRFEGADIRGSVVVRMVQFNPMYPNPPVGRRALIRFESERQMRGTADIPLGDQRLLPGQYIIEFTVALRANHRAAATIWIDNDPRFAPAGVTMERVQPGRTPAAVVRRNFHAAVTTDEMGNPVVTPMGQANARRELIDLVDGIPDVRSRLERERARLRGGAAGDPLVRWHVESLAEELKYRQGLASMAATERRVVDAIAIREKEILKTVRDYNERARKEILEIRNELFEVVNEIEWITSLCDPNWKPDGINLRAERRKWDINRFMNGTDVGDWDRPAWTTWYTNEWLNGKVVPLERRFNAVHAEMSRGRIIRPGRLDGKRTFQGSPFEAAYALLENSVFSTLRLFGKACGNRLVEIHEPAAARRWMHTNDNGDAAPRPFLRNGLYDQLASPSAAGLLYRVREVVQELSTERGADGPIGEVERWVCPECGAQYRKPGKCTNHAGHPDGGEMPELEKYDERKHGGSGPE
jgi:hypothetical protein